MVDGFGSAITTQQDSDIYLIPRRIFQDPFRGGPHIFVVSEAIEHRMNPAKGNYRAFAADMMERQASHQAWVWFDQEYMLFTSKTMGDPESGDAVCGDNACPQGNYYCGVGGNNVATGLRDVMDTHYAYCMEAEVKIGGCRVGRAPGQGVFTIGPCRGLNAGDHLVAARFLLRKCAEAAQIAISFDPKPVWAQYPDFDGSGCHVTISTKETRADGGIAVLEKCARALARREKDMKSCFGAGNERRLNGVNNVPLSAGCEYGVASRSVALRVPREVAITGKGAIQDRRPGANADPYRVSGMLMGVMGEIIQGAGATLAVEKMDDAVKDAIQDNDTANFTIHG
jgi:glutamine synthetase